MAKKEYIKKSKLSLPARSLRVGCPIIFQVELDENVPVEESFYYNFTVLLRFSASSFSSIVHSLIPGFFYASCRMLKLNERVLFWVWYVRFFESIFYAKKWGKENYNNNNVERIKSSIHHTATDMTRKRRLRNKRCAIGLARCLLIHVCALLPIQFPHFPPSPISNGLLFAFKLLIVQRVATCLLRIFYIVTESDEDETV